jgi:hypothetical protein
MNTGVRCYSEWRAAVECQSVYYRGSPQGNKVATALGFFAYVEKAAVAPINGF